MNCNTTHYRANSSSVPGDPTVIAVIILTALIYAAANAADASPALRFWILVVGVLSALGTGAAVAGQLHFFLVRVAQFPIILAIIYLATFLLIWVAPGDPFVRSDKNISDTAKAALREKFHAQHWYTFVTYYPVQVIAHGDFGPSLANPRKTVNEIISEKLPISVMLGLAAVAIATTAGVSIGTLSALPVRRPVNLVVLGLIILAVSVASRLLNNPPWMQFLFIAIAVFGACRKYPEAALEIVLLVGVLIGADLLTNLLALPLVGPGWAMVFRAGVAALICVLTVVAKGPSDAASLTLAVAGISVPSFVAASALVIIFATKLNLFPADGWPDGAVTDAHGTHIWPTIATYARHMALPAFALALAPLAYVTRLTRVSMIDVLGSDYVRTARAKGMTKPTVVVKHCLRNALLPVLSYIGPAAAGTLVGSFIIEKVFNIPGLGQYFVTSVQNRDQTLILGTVMVESALVLALNLVVEISYVFVDPRIDISARR